MNTTNQQFTYHKIKLCLNLTEHIENTSINKFPALYIGSNLDLEFPLLLQARKIIMIDPCHKDKKNISLLINKAQQYDPKNTDYKEISPKHSNLQFDFDFGRGKERAKVDIFAEKYEDYEPILPLGYIIEFNTKLNHTLCKPEILEKLVIGGLIINNHESPLRHRTFGIGDILTFGQDINSFEAKKAKNLGLQTIRIDDVPFAVYKKTRQETKLIEFAERNRECQ
ncbi:hypothetical protein KJ855_03285 [Patescibacteria group bacterium]|nr:hypothetical protein [Patescibacteria group bacterium]